MAITHHVRGQRGAVLLASILVLSMLLVLGSLSMRLAMQEIMSVRAAADEAAARHLAEAGVGLVVQWFHDPGSVPLSLGSARFLKRYDLPDTGPSFFSAQGYSQFTGTQVNPDVWLDGTKPEDHRVLDESVTALFQTFPSLGRIVHVKVFGPSRLGLLCTVEVSAAQGEASKTVSVQLRSPMIPPVRAGVQVGARPSAEGPTAQEEFLPVWVHWGDLKAKGDVSLNRRDMIPEKTMLARVTQQPYADMAHREDRWLDFWVGGEAFFDSPSAPGPEEVPENVHPRQDPDPGLQLDLWDYATLKEAAQLFGSYYVTGWDGLLYPDGIIVAGLGLTPDMVFESEGVGDRRGLVFIDTLDQQPPDSTNLGTIVLEAAYAEGVFVANAHVVWRPRGQSRRLSALAPPPEGSSAIGERVPIQLEAINLAGVLYVAGNITIEAALRAYGSVVAEGVIRQASGTSGVLEIWYDHDLASGYFRGVPVVHIAPGTWIEHP